MNGSFVFRVRKYVIEGKSTNWLRMTNSEIGECHSSKRLLAYALNLCRFVSYEISERLVSERMGNDKLSDQGIKNYVSDYALEIKETQELQISDCKAINYECNGIPVDIYSLDF